jgi:putative transposase
MANPRRQFSFQEKYNILQAAEYEGIAATARKYYLDASLIRRWNKEYLTKEKGRQKPGYKKADRQLQSLEKENIQLKKIIVNQALELEFKTELLKKSNTSYQKGRR